MKLSFALPSVVLTVGPKGAGKTIWAKEFIAKCKDQLAPALHHKIYHIEFERVRYEIINSAGIKSYDSKIANYDKLTIDRIYLILRQITSFPINTFLIVIESHSLDIEYLNQINTISREFDYNFEIVSFDYKDRKTYANVFETISQVHKQKLYDENYLKHMIYNRVQINEDIDTFRKVISALLIRCHFH